MQRFETNAANANTGNQRLHGKALQRQQYRLGANHGDEDLIEKARGHNLKMMAQAKYLLSKSSSSRKIIFSKNESNKQFLSPDRARTLEPSDSFSKVRETDAATKLIGNEEENSDEEVAPNLRNLVSSPNRIHLSSRMVATQESAPDKPVEGQDTGSQKTSSRKSLIVVVSKTTGGSREHSQNLASLANFSKEDSDEKQRRRAQKDGPHEVRFSLNQATGSIEPVLGKDKSNRKKQFALVKHELAKQSLDQLPATHSRYSGKSNLEEDETKNGRVISSYTSIDKSGQPMNTTAAFSSQQDVKNSSAEAESQNTDKLRPNILGTANVTQRSGIFSAATAAVMGQTPTALQRPYEVLNIAAETNATFNSQKQRHERGEISIAQTNHKISASFQPVFGNSMQEIFGVDKLPDGRLNLPPRQAQKKAQGVFLRERE